MMSTNLSQEDARAKYRRDEGSQYLPRFQQEAYSYGYNRGRPTEAPSRSHDFMGRTSNSHSQNDLHSEAPWFKNNPDQQMSENEQYLHSKGELGTMNPRMEEHHNGRTQLAYRGENKAEQYHRSPQAFPDTEGIPYLSKNFMMNKLLFSENSQYSDIKKPSKAKKNLENMKKLYSIKRFKLVYKCLRDALAQEQEILGQILKSKKIDQPSQRNELVGQQTPLADKNQSPFDPRIQADEPTFKFESEQQHPERRRRKSDSSFNGSEYSLMNSGKFQKMPIINFGLGGGNRGKGSNIKQEVLDQKMTKRSNLRRS